MSAILLLYRDYRILEVAGFSMLTKIKMNTLPRNDPYVQGKRNVTIIRTFILTEGSIKHFIHGILDFKIG
jgi:hypothetical protein